MARSDLRRRFEEIYMAHYADLLAYVRRRTESPEDAADALAETFATAWRRIADVPPGPSARLWLYGVARRVLANGRRAATRRSALVERLGAELGHGASTIGHRIARISTPYARRSGASAPTTVRCWRW